MDAITYRVLVCFSVAVMFGIMSIKGFKDAKKFKEHSEHKKRNEYLTKKRYLSKMVIVALELIITLFAIGFGGYLSQDLIYKDYVTERGVLIDDFTKKRQIQYQLDTGDKTVVFYLSRWAITERKELVVGEKYEIVYAKRTEILIDFKKIG